jgi:hypothetical protein
LPGRANLAECDGLEQIRGLLARSGHDHATIAPHRDRTPSGQFIRVSSRSGSSKNSCAGNAGLHVASLARHAPVLTSRRSDRRRPPSVRRPRLKPPAADPREPRLAALLGTAPWARPHKAPRGVRRDRHWGPRPRCRRSSAGAEWEWRLRSDLTIAASTAPGTRSL